MAAAQFTPDILAFGEPMVEFNQTGQGAGRLYLQGFGGDTSNFAIAAARQGARVGYLSALGDDPYGVMLRRLWDDEGLDHADVATDPQAFTAIYFVTHGAQGHHFHFFRKGSAASRMTPAQLSIGNSNALFKLTGPGVNPTPPLGPGPAHSSTA
jgi:2-dehydro-3-deoxygluconokinase